MRRNLRFGGCAIRGISTLSALLAIAATTACRQSAEDHLRAAQDAMFLGNPRRALNEYERAAELAARENSTRSPFVQSRALRGAADVCYLELREPARAAAIYRRLIRIHPERPEALEARVSLSHILRSDLHDLRGAIAELAAAIARQPPWVAALRYEMAKLYFELGNYRQSALEAEAILQRYGTSAVAARANFLKAEALAMIDGRSSEAILALEQLLERFPDSELEPHVLYQLGRLRAEAGDLEAAIEQWVLALKMHPNPSFIQSAISRARKRLEQASASDRVAEALIANAVFDGLSTLRDAERQLVP
ncbi:MAG TPA: tetratricopeptide repeat protein [Myxococcaceae bacterium]|nr:tetratricopeptide repeat protein [Myxococcaceae bacterium]